MRLRRYGRLLYSRRYHRHGVDPGTTILSVGSLHRRSHGFLSTLNSSSESCLLLLRQQLDGTSCSHLLWSAGPRSCSRRAFHRCHLGRSFPSTGLQPRRGPLASRAPSHHFWPRMRQRARNPCQYSSGTASRRRCVPRGTIHDRTPWVSRITQPMPSSNVASASSLFFFFYFF